MKLGLTLGFGFLLISSFAKAEQISFSTVWGQINTNSAAQEASRLQTESLLESSSRASRHWLPRVYLDAKGYQTNDPGSSFFGLLEQRALTQTDFSPDSINHPQSQIYTRGALGIDLPLYEGGIKSSQVDLLKHSAEAQKFNTTQTQLEQYASVGLSYGSLLVLEQQLKKLQVLNGEVVRLTNNYQIGQKSNPVGYSGLLGLKSLLNRLKGLINQHESQSRTQYAILREMGLKNTSWIPTETDAGSFVDRYFTYDAKNNDSQRSYKLEATQESVKAIEEMTNMEKAKFLPRVGAFAETYSFRGDRDTSDGYTAGLYLQWNLFDPGSYGSFKEARLKAMAASKYSEASEQQERTERAALNESLKTLRDNIILLNESYGLLVEQSKTSETLFKNGSINALQIVELLNRKADLIQQQSEAEIELIKVSSQLVTKYRFDIGAQPTKGGSNEQ